MIARGAAPSGLAGDSAAHPGFPAGVGNRNKGYPPRTEGEEALVD
jgi:hypothetical protein